MRRRHRSGLAAAAILASALAAPASAQGTPPSVDERRATQMKADILSLKAMLSLRDGQAAPWDAYEGALQRGIGDSRSFGIAYCTLGGSIVDTVKGPAALAKRTADLEILFRQRAKELAALAGAEKDFTATLSPEQARTYDMLSGRVMGMAMLPAYATASNGVPGMCPPPAMPFPRPGR